MLAEPTDGEALLPIILSCRQTVDWINVRFSILNHQSATRVKQIKTYDEDWSYKPLK